MPQSPTPLALTDEIIHTQLHNGERVCVRTIRPSDEERMRSGITELSSRSRYLRFFSGFRIPPDPIIERLVDVDGHRHLAWGAILTSASNHPAIGAVHVFRNESQTPAGDFSVAIADAYQGLGLARILTAIILINCTVEHITYLDVHVLYENRAARNLVRSLGGELQQMTGNVSEYTLHVETALNTLREQANQTGLKQVFGQLRRYC